jgi:TetR/AcrR family transcriptional repressor of nem operon
MDDICEAAGLSKGSFFHHFASKEDLAVAAAAHWSAVTGALFAAAPYHAHADPLARVFGYLAFRRQLLRGALPEFTCYAGTTVQETFGTHPAIGEACGHSITSHAAVLAKDIAEAKRRYAPRATWSAEGLALHTQAVLQGAFVVAKATGGAEAAVESLDHLVRYFELLFGRSTPSQEKP